MGRILQDLSLRNKDRIFRDRLDAGHKLLSFIRSEMEIDNAIVCTIPAGGVPIGVELSLGLSCPLAITVVRKLQIPGNPEAGFGAMTWDGKVYLNKELVGRLSLTDAEIEEAIENTRMSVQERVGKYMEGRPLTRVEGKTLIIADDGLASGYTMIAAVNAVRELNPADVIVAVPTGSVSAVAFVGASVNVLVCLNLRTGYHFAVADAYAYWNDLSPDDVELQLERATLTSLF